MVMKDIQGLPDIQKVIVKSKPKHWEQPLYVMLKNWNGILDKVQKGLEDFLERKRRQFARFFFLSNDELITLMSETAKEVRAVQQHLRKLFDNLYQLKFTGTETNEI